MIKHFSQSMNPWVIAMAAQIAVLVLGNYAFSANPAAKFAVQSIAMSIAFYALFQVMNLRLSVLALVAASLVLATFAVFGVRYAFG